jgi:hypothetical protein
MLRGFTVPRHEDGTVLLTVLLLLWARHWRQVGRVVTRNTCISDLSWITYWPVRLVLLLAVTMKNAVLSDMRRCTLVDIDRRSFTKPEKFYQTTWRHLIEDSIFRILYWLRLLWSIRKVQSHENTAWPSSTFLPTLRPWQLFHFIQRYIKSSTEKT